MTDGGGTPAASAGVARRLRRLGGERGVIAGIALDHRDSLRVVLEREGVAGTDDEGIRELKARLAAVLAPAATAAMLDAELGCDALVRGAVPPHVGLIMPLEAQGYETLGEARLTLLLDDFSPAAALAWGADACKLLLPYRADDVAAADRQDALVERVAGACHALGLPLVAEPVVQPRAGEPSARFAIAYRGLVVAAVARLAARGVDLIKAPFPLHDPASAATAEAARACAEVTAACDGVPWVLLGAGVATATFLDQLRSAGRAGASGFLAGRGIWRDALTTDADAAARLAQDVSLPAFQRCREVAETVCVPLRPLVPPGMLAAT